jgi:ribosomal protein S18 acetylase RimI-like enzyme
VSDQRVRSATPADVEKIVQLVYELAEYEKLVEECHLTSDLLRAALFGDAPALFGHVALAEGEIVGYTLHFLNYSTWEGVHGIYLEDLYVKPGYRGSGLGKALLLNLTEIAVRERYARVEWSVLNWNAPSIAFYEAIGAIPMNGWSVYRLTGPALARTATGTG